MFSFWEIMVVCSNHLLLLYTKSASLLPHCRKGIEITLQNNLEIAELPWSHVVAAAGNSFI